MFSMPATIHPDWRNEDSSKRVFDGNNTFSQSDWTPEEEKKARLK